MKNNGNKMYLTEGGLAICPKLPVIKRAVDGYTDIVVSPDNREQILLHQAMTDFTKNNSNNIYLTEGGIAICPKIPVIKRAVDVYTDIVVSPDNRQHILLHQGRCLGGCVPGVWFSSIG